MGRAIFPHARPGWLRVVIRVPELAVFEQMHEFIFIDKKLLKILSQHRCAEVFSGVRFVQCGHGPLLSAIAPMSPALQPTRVVGYFTAPFHSRSASRAVPRRYALLPTLKRSIQQIAADNVPQTHDRLPPTRFRRRAETTAR